MAEAKNTFIQSKMNKDMDGRILPNGQYRDGQNVQISRSEGDDVGALENVLGNELLSDFGLTNPNLEIIGHLTNDTLDSIFLFLTDYTDSSASTLDNNISGIGGECYIVQYTLSTNNVKILVEGNFLNFSKTHPVLGITLLEDLLFWTDNRNQPRKININLATTGFYTNEDQISVAKYYPYEPISLLEEVPVNKGKYQSTMKDKFSPYLPIHAAARIKEVNGNDVVLDGQYTNIRPGNGGGCGDLMSGSCVGINSPVNTVNIVGNETTVVLENKQFNQSDADMPGCIVYFQRQNPDQDISWPGDPEYLKEKFVRFSYRFKFVDGEYSLSAPFTQIAFVPEQDGYFIGDNATDYDSDTSIGAIVGDEGRTMDSTIVSFMENKINDIELYIPAPSNGNGTDKYLFSEINNKLNIIEVDILYKAADSNKTTIVDTLTLEDFSNLNSEYLTYDYQSRKPWKTLAPIQTTRVSDVVPVRALTQESAGNRIIYGNFIDKHTSPINLNYTLTIDQKPALPTVGSPVINDRNLYVRKEYQNHTLKQNRTYQVGVVLSDRYGRQSNVILSSVINPNVSDQNGSTIYHRYKNAEDPMLLDKYPEDVYDPADERPPYAWPGDQLNAVFYSIIPDIKTQDGYPGIYSVADGSVASLTVSFSPTYTAAGNWNPALCAEAQDPGLPITFQNTSDPTQNGTGKAIFDSAGNVIAVTVDSSTNNFLNGTTVVVQFVAGPVVPGCEILDSPVTGSVQCIVSTPVDNPLGWYSYKFVVKQTEQEYYNVYLPTTLAGYPCEVTGQEFQQIAFDEDGLVTQPGLELIPKFEYPNSQQSVTSHIVLYSDNINKVPRDLQEVGPTQEKYRSSVRLYGRVNNELVEISGVGQSVSNVGFNPGRKFDLAAQVATMTRLGLGDLLSNPAIPIIPNIFYKGETDPAIAVIQTNKQFGVVAGADGCTPSANPPNANSLKYGTTISVYETEPVESLLDIFWETTSSGLIRDLNDKIVNEDNTIPIGITDPQLNWNESDGYNDIVSSTFEAQSVTGAGLGAACSITLDSVVRGDGQVTTMFEIEEQGLGTGEYVVKIKPGPNDPGGAFRPLFLCWEEQIKNIYYFTFTITRDDGINPITVIQTQVTGTTQNTAPVKREPSQLAWDNIKDASNDRFNDPSLANDQVSFTNWIFRPEQPIAGYQNCAGNTTIPNDPRCIFGQMNPPGYGVVKAQETMFNTNGVIPSDIPWVEGPNANCPTPLNNRIYPVAFTNGADFYDPPVPSNAPNFTAVGTFDGDWGVYNGSYGSVVGITPPSNFTGEEIIWTIPRMYQVSSYTDIGFFDNVSYGKAYEVIFGVQNNFLNLTRPCCDSTPFNADCCLPPGPIYWHFSGDNPTPDQMLTENKVGQLYNNGQHYWPDIQHMIVNQIDAGFYPTLDAHPAMNIVDGANSFYQIIQKAPLNFWQQAPQNAAGLKYYLGLPDSNGLGDPLNTRYRFNINQLPQTFQQSGFSEPIRAQIFAGEKSIDSSPWMLSGNYVSSGDGSFTPTNSFQEAVANWAFGNGIPGGRYVVTIRATDRSTITQNFSGLYTEYDVPIFVPSFRFYNEGFYTCT